MSKKKRILVISDMHCGHLTGLTPPDYWWSNSDTKWRKKIHDYQRWAWNTYRSYLDEFMPFNKVICLGDCIDGKGKLSGGNEQLTTDRNEQVNMAVQCIKASGVQGKNIAIARGTCYHTGRSEDWEDGVARELKCEIHNHLFIDVNGVGISARHFIGGTSVPQGKATAILKEQVSNDTWKREYKDHPNANIFLRGHVHRAITVDEPQTLSIIAPSLQGWTDFGAKKCSMPVHFGIIVIDIDAKGDWKWYRRTAPIGQFVQSTKW